MQLVAQWEARVVKMFLVATFLLSMATLGMAAAMVPVDTVAGPSLQLRGRKQDYSSVRCVLTLSGRIPWRGALRRS